MGEKHVEQELLDQADTGEHGDALLIWVLVVIITIAIHGRFLLCLKLAEILHRFGSKAKDREERLNDSNNNGQLRIANATSGGPRKAAWAKISM